MTSGNEWRHPKVMLERTRSDKSSWQWRTTECYCTSELSATASVSASAWQWTGGDPRKHRPHGPVLNRLHPIITNIKYLCLYCAPLPHLILHLHHYAWHWRKTANDYAFISRGRLLRLYNVIWLLIPTVFLKLQSRMGTLTTPICEPVLYQSWQANLHTSTGRCVNYRSKCILYVTDFSSQHSLVKCPEPQFITVNLECVFSLQLLVFDRSAHLFISCIILQTKLSGQNHSMKWSNHEW